jgi:hypothetical protein
MNVELTGIADANVAAILRGPVLYGWQWNVLRARGWAVYRDDKWTLTALGLAERAKMGEPT